MSAIYRRHVADMSRDNVALVEQHYKGQREVVRAVSEIVMMCSNDWKKMVQDMAWVCNNVFKKILICFLTKGVEWWHVFWTIVKALAFPNKALYYV